MEQTKQVMQDSRSSLLPIAARAMVGFRSMVLAIFVLRSLFCILHVIGLMPMDITHSLFSIVIFSPSIFQSCRMCMGRTPPADEIRWHVVPLLVGGYIMPVYIFLATDSCMDSAVGLLLFPMTGILATLMQVCFHVVDGKQYSLRPMLMMMLPGLCANFYRCSQEHEACRATFPLISVSCVTVGVVHAIAWTGDVLYTIVQQLKCAIAHSEAIRCDLEKANSALEDTRRAMGSLLSAMCDIVSHVDSNLCFHEPSQQTYNLFMPGQIGLASELHGCSVLDFIKDPTDKQRFRQLLSQELDQANSATASCVNLKMVDSLQREFTVAVFHARMGNPGTNPLHVVGILETKEQLSTETDMQQVSEESDNSTLSTDPSQGLPFGPPQAPLDLRVQNSSASSRVSIPNITAYINLCHISIAFDAGTNRFDLFTVHPCVRCSPGTKSGNLKSLIFPDHWLQLAAWVEREIQEAPWDLNVTTNAYPGDLAVGFNHRSMKGWYAVVNQAWLDISPPEDGILPAVLFLQGFSKAQPVLASLHEEDVNEPAVDDDPVSAVDEDNFASIVQPNDSIRCITSQEHCRQRLHVIGRDDLQESSGAISSGSAQLPDTKD